MKISTLDEQRLKQVILDTLRRGYDLGDARKDMENSMNELREVIATIIPLDE